MLTPCALLLSTCTAVTPTYKDNGTRSGPCAEGSPDNVTQQFYDYRILRRGNNITTLRPYLGDEPMTLLSGTSQDSNRWELLTDNPFSSRATLSDSAHIANISAIPNHNARNIPLCVDLKQGDQGWQGEVLMIQGGQCWVTDDMYYLGGSVHVTAGTLRQSIESR